MSKTDLQFVAQAEARRAESDDHERRIARLEKMLLYLEGRGAEAALNTRAAEFRKLKDESAERE